MQEKRAPRVRYSLKLYGEDVSDYRSASLRCKLHILPRREVFVSAEAGNYGKERWRPLLAVRCCFVVARRAELPQQRATLSPDSEHNTPEHR